jgi:outer membrane receptor protein involved in Fe transport
VAALAVALVVPSFALADDLADEADLQFQLGADAYQRGDHRAALQHFLASNRLVANKNVLFNIARAYEKLGRYPEAHRYFSLALGAETEAAARDRIQKELDQLANRVLVLEIRTNPPGATLYVNRKDLGPRGESPRKLGLAPGRYKIIAEKPGYRSAEITVGPGRVGEVKRVELELIAILGSVRIEGPARGAEVHLDEEAAKASCTVPCSLRVAPGRHVLYLTKPGHRTSAVPVSVRANAELTVRPELAPITGSLVASTDEPGALIEVDGRPVGFTPAIVPVPIGSHRVRLSLEGFRAVERELTFREGRQTRLEATLIGFEEVIAASRQSEAVEDAPSSVTIVPAQELSALAYPTIAEAVRGVRGVYVWDDRSYVSLGFRGIGRLGSYGNRVLVLLDGHPLNDNWIGSSYVGYDARTDLADIQRIEVVRGPGSVLYGTNAFSGVINLVTRDKNVPPGVEAGISTNLDAVGRARVRGNARFEGGGIWTSVAGVQSTGRDFYFPEYATDTPPEIAGHARGVDGFEAGTINGRLWWRWLTAQWFLHSHSKQIPTGQYDTTLGDPRTSQTDTRTSLELRAEPEIAKGVELLSRAHLNHYRFDGRYARQPLDGGVEVDEFRGSWVGFEQRVVLEASEGLRLTLGGEGQLHFQVDQSARDDDGVFLDETGDQGRPFEVGAAYANVDARVSERLALSAGARLDSYSTFGSSLNPRAAVIVRPYARGNTKLMGGKAFRAPSVYELYYNDGGATQISSPELKPESMYSVELEHAHRFSTAVSATGAVFANYVTNLIVTRGGDGTEPIHYQNSGVPLASVGGELELRREWRQGWMLAGSYAYARPVYLESSNLGALVRLDQDPDSRRVANAPAHLAAFKGAVPILSRGLTAATRVSFEDGRYDRFEQSGDEPQERSDWVVIWDLVLSGIEPRWGLRYALGVYNAFDWQSSLPVSQEFRQRTIPQSGRTFLATADLTF